MEDLRGNLWKEKFKLVENRIDEIIKGTIEEITILFCV